MNDPLHLPAPRGLHYVTDTSPGIARERRAQGFRYRRADGRLVRDAGQLDRIRRLAIPPAYEQVWICPDAAGHIQATGRDARGRKQYRYHALWRTARDGDKFARMLEFGSALPRIRARVARDLSRPVTRGHVARTPVLAALVRLLDTTLIRVGNEEYARSNKSYGLTTLRTRHAQVVGSRLRLHFRGKSGVVHQVSLNDRRVTRVVRACQCMPGQELFTYEDGAGEHHTIGSGDVNAYLREASGADFTAKDFRTWHASAHALALLRGNLGTIAGSALTKAQVNTVLAEVAGLLGNTVAVCRKSYVHPTLLAQAADGSLSGRITPSVRTSGRAGLLPDERCLLGFLRVVEQDRSHNRSRRAS